LNADRGPHNLFLTFEAGRPTLRLIDHGHVLLLPREGKNCSPPPEDWADFVVSGRLEEEALSRSLLTGYLAQLATAQEVLSGARTIQELPETAIDDALEPVDDEFFLCGKETIVTLLKHRRERLIDVLVGIL
jgi:hypothetical protein